MAVILTIKGEAFGDRQYAIGIRPLDGVPSPPRRGPVVEDFQVVQVGQEPQVAPQCLVRAATRPGDGRYGQGDLTAATRGKLEQEALHHAPQLWRQVGGE